MAKPEWQKRLEQVLGHKTIEISKISQRTGNEYKTDAIQALNVFSTGSFEQTADGKFRYAVVDPQQGLEYNIKAPNQVEVKFGVVLSFKNVCGGSTPNGGGWYSADSVAIVQRNA
jgi:hypothetical protein